jgi:hypothetical protein
VNVLSARHRGHGGGRTRSRPHGITRVFVGMFRVPLSVVCQAEPWSSTCFMTSAKASSMSMDGPRAASLEGAGARRGDAYRADASITDAHAPVDLGEVDRRTVVRVMLRC